MNVSRISCSNPFEIYVNQIMPYVLSLYSVVRQLFLNNSVKEIMSSNISLKTKKHFLRDDNLFVV